MKIYENDQFTEKKYESRVELFNVGHILTNFFKKKKSAINTTISYAEFDNSRGLKFKEAMYIPPDLTKSGESNTITIQLRTDGTIQDENSAYDILFNSSIVHKYYGQVLEIEYERTTPIKCIGMALSPNSKSMYLYEFNIKYTIFKKIGGTNGKKRI